MNEKKIASRVAKSVMAMSKTEKYTDDIVGAIRGLGEIGYDVYKDEDGATDIGKLRSKTQMNLKEMAKAVSGLQKVFNSPFDEDFKTLYTNLNYHGML